MSQTGPGHPDDGGIPEPSIGPAVHPQGGTLTGQAITAGRFTFQAAEEPPAAWILRPEDLDRLPTLRQMPTEEEEAASATSALLAAYRPDAGGAWPEDRVTVSYAELRRLIALHLSTCAQTMPRERPWHFMALRARAMLDGEVPLLLSEVMDK